MLSASHQAGPQGKARLQDVGGLGRFVRSPAELDREAAKRAFGEFLAHRPFSADQLEFLDLIIDHLTERGLMDPKLLYESPFTDFDPNGVDGVFSRPMSLYQVPVWLTHEGGFPGVVRM